MAFVQGFVSGSLFFSVLGVEVGPQACWQALNPSPFHFVFQLES
jgi:hypothetical protein